MSQAKKISEILAVCEADLRAGRAHEVRSRLEDLKIKKMPREFLLPLANVARRAGLFMLGLKFLSSCCRGSSSGTAAEMAEYAVLLQKIGAHEEASAFLERIEKNIVPAAHLYQAYQCFHQWDGEGAIPCLESYLEAELDDYQRAIAQVNLAAAYILADRYDEATEVLMRSVESHQKMGFARLAGNCHEMLGQVFIHNAQWEKAKAELERAAGLLQGESTPDAFFVHKWRSILQALEASDIRPLASLRAEALARQDWESLRDADLYLVKITREKNRFEHLYFGTPFAGYRARALKVSGFSAPPAGQIYWYGREPALKRLDLQEGAVVEPGSKLHQLLTALLLDLYRPLRVAGLFATLFPEESFDPFSSPDRIHRLIARARQSLQKAGLPLAIEQVSEGFQVGIHGPLQLALRIDRQPADRHQLMLERLAEAFQEKMFSARMASDLLGGSASAFKRLAAWGVRERRLEKVGAGASTLYRLNRKRSA